jgi:hypothetical protein
MLLNDLGDESVYTCCADLAKSVTRRREGRERGRKQSHPRGIWK